jgi:hypothetical protein
MTEMLTDTGYQQTRSKLRRLQQRLERLETRDDLSPAHLAAVRRSYQEMMRQYLREIKLYETHQTGAANAASKHK